MAAADCGAARAAAESSDNATVAVADTTMHTPTTVAAAAAAHSVMHSPIAADAATTGGHARLPLCHRGRRVAQLPGPAHRRRQGQRRRVEAHRGSDVEAQGRGGAERHVPRGAAGAKAGHRGLQLANAQGHPDGGRRRAPRAAMQDVQRALRTAGHARARGISNGACTGPVTVSPPPRHPRQEPRRTETKRCANRVTLRGQMRPDQITNVHAQER